jgi:hypothetical protein
MNNKLLINDRIQTILFSVIAFYILALPLILLDYNNGRAFSDQINFHLPTIIYFTQQFDFSDYPSATTPGYHLLLAIAGKIFSLNEIFLKIISSLFTAAFIGLISNMLYRNFGKFKTLLLLLPMIYSIYIFPAGVWLLPDNLAWLTVAGVLVLAMNSPPTKKQYIYVGFIFTAAMLVRQPNLWLAAAIWGSSLAYYFFEKKNLAKKISIVVQSILVTVPAFVLFYMFYHMWGGLVPPSFQIAHEHISLSVPAFFFAAFFVYSIFFFPIFFGSIKHLKIENKYRWIMFGLVLGFVVSILPDTSYSVESGRSSGLWNFVKLAPSYLNKSSLIVVLSTLGGGMYFAMMLLIKKDIRFIMMLSTLAFMVALIPNAFVYERYFAGYIFIVIYLVLSQSTVQRWNVSSGMVWVSPIIFSLLNLFIMISGLLR